MSLLEHYYDVARADQFDALFQGLYVGERPTQERNRYLVLKLDFSGLSTAKGEDALRDSFYQQLRSTLRRFCNYYAPLLSGLLAQWEALDQQPQGEPADLLTAFLHLLAGAHHPLYILIDEHDKFVNDLVALGDHKTYQNILGASGFVRHFYERIKAGTDSVVKRLFMTGVTPGMVNDMASGFNIVKPIFLLEEFNELCGFSQSEVEQLVDGVLAAGTYRVLREQLLLDLRRYYDGYRFSEQVGGHVYNPDMVLYFFSELRPPDRYPRQLLDMNVRTDHSRLHRLLFTADETARPKAVEQVRALIAEGSMLGTLHDLFPLERAYEEKYFASYLYYLGLVSIDGISRGQLRLAIPNVVIRETYGETLSYILALLVDVKVDEDQLKASAAALAYDGDLAPLLSLLFQQVMQKLSNRDLIRMDERALKLLLLTYLSLTDLYHPFSEMELGRGYTDLILVPTRQKDEARYGVVLELKYLPEEALKPKAGAKGKTAASREQTLVEAQFQEAEAQLARYLQDPRLAKLTGPLGWKAFSVVQLGKRALHFREPGHEAALVKAK